MLGMAAGALELTVRTNDSAGSPKQYRMSLMILLIDYELAGSAIIVFAEKDENDNEQNPCAIKTIK